MTYGYIRCSNNENEKNIDRQRRELKKLGVGDDEIFLEYINSSKKEGTMLNRLFSITAVQGDTIATTKVSYLTLSTNQLCEILGSVRKKKLQLIVGTFKIDCRNEIDPMTDGMLKMADMFSEIEQNIKIHNIKFGMEKAKANGTRLGRPHKAQKDLPYLFTQNVHKYELKEITQEELAQICGVTRPTISKYIKINKNTQEEIAKREFDLDMKKETQKEEKRMKSIRRLTDDELDAEIKKEELYYGLITWRDEWNLKHRGLTRKDVPAIYERMRRDRAIQKELKRKLDEEMERE